MIRLHGWLNHPHHLGTGRQWAQRLDLSPIHGLTVADVIVIVSVNEIEAGLTDVISKRAVAVGSVNPEVVVTSDEMTDGLIIVKRGGEGEVIRGQTSDMDVVEHVPPNGIGSPSPSLKLSQDGS